MNDVPFDVFDEEDPDSERITWESLYKEGSGTQPPIDAVSANYYLGRIKQNKEKMKSYEEQAKQMKDDFIVRVEQWLDTRRSSLDYDTQHCMDMLEIYYERNKPANGKPISLPEGNIGIYATRENFDFDTNADKILPLLEKDDALKEFIRYKPSINKMEIKKACAVKDGIVYIHGKKMPLVGYTPKGKAFSIR